MPDLLRLPGFVRLLAVRWPSQAGDGMFQLGVASLLLFALSPTEATSGVEVAEVLAVTTLPFSLVGPFAGVVIDRWRRQRILIWANVVRVMTVVAALPVAGRGSAGQTVFLAAVVVVLSTNRFFLATLGAVLPKVVPGEALVPANAVSTIGGSILSLVGAAVAGLVAGLIGEDRGGPEVAVLLALTLFVASVLAATRLPADVLGPDLEGDVPPLRRELRRAYDELVDGIRRISASRRAWAPIAILTVLRFFTAIATITALLVFRNKFGAGPAELGVIFALFGLGAFVGAMLVAWGERRLGLTPEAAMKLSVLLGGVATAAFAPGLLEWALLAVNVFLGIAFAAGKIAGDTLVQSALPDRFRGRVFAAYDVLYNVGFLLGGVTAAAAVPDVSAAEPVLVGLGLATVAFYPVARWWLSHMPPPVDVESWEQAQQVLDRAR